MKVSELSGAALDKAVAHAHGMMLYHEDWQPSRRWDQGGPIIERERMDIDPHMGGWIAWDEALHVRQEGRTLLEAAMRCYVASKFGEEVPDQ